MTAASATAAAAAAAAAAAMTAASRARAKPGAPHPQASAQPPTPDSPPSGANFPFFVLCSTEGRGLLTVAFTHGCLQGGSPVARGCKITLYFPCTDYLTQAFKAEMIEIVKGCMEWSYPDVPGLALAGDIPFADKGFSWYLLTFKG